jgi:hypothetical protein
MRDLYCQIYYITCRLILLIHIPSVGLISAVSIYTPSGFNSYPSGFNSYPTPATIVVNCGGLFPTMSPFLVGMGGRIRPNPLLRSASWVWQFYLNVILL